MPPRFTLGNGEANSLSLLWSRAREISSSALLDAGLPAGLGIAALDGYTCRSRAVKPDHAPTWKEWEHDLLPCAASVSACAAIFENANRSRLQCDLQTLVTSNVNVTRPDWPTSTAGDGDDVVQRSGACIRFRA